MRLWLNGAEALRVGIYVHNIAQCNIPIFGPSRFYQNHWPGWDYYIVYTTTYCSTSILSFTGSLFTKSRIDSDYDFGISRKNGLEIPESTRITTRICWQIHK